MHLSQFISCQCIHPNYSFSLNSIPIYPFIQFTLSVTSSVTIYTFNESANSELDNQSVFQSVHPFQSTPTCFQLSLNSPIPIYPFSVFIHSSLYFHCVHLPNLPLLLVHLIQFTHSVIPLI